jgi:small subunit ribosomal protein S1
MSENKSVEIKEGESLTDSQKEQMELMKSQETPKTEVEFGDAVKGKVVSISKDSVFVDISLRNEAILAKSEVTDKDGKVTVAEGDELELYVITVKSDEVTLSKSIKNGKANKQLLRTLMEREIPVEGRVSGMNKGGFNVKILGKPAFCPLSTIDIGFPEDPAKYMGQVLDFIIARIENRGNNIVLTRLPLLQGDVKGKLDELDIAAKAGTPVAGTVSRVVNFGAFVELGGIEGLIHISELTWDRDEQAEGVVKAGQSVSVKVLKIDRNEPLRDSRISLSLKRLDKDPWEDAMVKINEGDVIEGEVSRIVGFGAFVKIFPGVEALVRTEEMGWGRIHKPSDIVKKGEKIKISIINIDDTGRKIDGSLKDKESDPWNGIEEKFGEGKKVEGKVADEKDYGYFIDLNESVTGLLPKRRVAKDKIGSFKKGDTIEVTIDSLDTDAHRISLSFGDVEEYKPQEKRGGGEDKAAAAKYMKNQDKQDSGESDFAAALKAALKK